MKQSEVFLNGEGKEWLKRNRLKLPVANDPVLKAIESVGFRPGSVLEVGCSNGWRLKKLNEIYGSIPRGIDPQAAKNWPMHDNFISKGDASSLRYFSEGAFDTVIYGWCLYLCDREDLFKIASEGDRVLSEGGHLIVHDFSTTSSYKRKYKHHEGLFSYKMDYSMLWLWNPAYKLVSWNVFGTGDDATSVTIMKKDTARGWPLKTDET